MKRNEKWVTGFDEIIFENRNREYGAYVLRKSYKSTTSFSILAATVIITLVLILLLLDSKPTTASDHTGILVIAQMDNYIPEPLKQTEIKPPAELIKATQNVVPEVVTDTAEVTEFIPTTEEVIQATTDGDVNDTVIVYTDVPSDVIPVETKPFIHVEEMPEFPGGASALLEYIAKNTRYPDIALENYIQGRVFLKFVVNTDGSVGVIEIMKGVDPQLDKEAIRVIGTLPKFRPGKQNGVPVPVWYAVPVLFRIDDVR
jgi:protein TonB